MARLERPRTDTRTRLAVVADPHLAPDGHGTWKVHHRSRERFETALGIAERIEADLLLVPGDVTDSGTPRQVDVAAALLDAVDLPTLVLPGNHDVPKAWNSPDGIGLDGFVDRLGRPLPAAVEVGPLTILAVDTATARDGSLADTWGGRIGERQRAWLAERVGPVEDSVVVCHHNLGPLPENPGGKWDNFPVGDDDAVRALLADVDVPLAITGHHHVPTVRSLEGTTEVLSPATCSFPQAMLAVDVGPTGTTIRLLPLADRGGLVEARALARTKPLAVSVMEVVEDRLARVGSGPLDPEG